MTDETDEEGGIEFQASATDLFLHDGQCWLCDPDYLDPSNEYDGVLAVQYRDGAIYWLSGVDRKWRNVEEEKKPEGPKRLRSVQ